MGHVGGSQGTGASVRALAAGRGACHLRVSRRALYSAGRPTLKSAYPLTPFERYVGWKRADGAPFDPWLRVHHRLGAEFLEIMPKALVVTGTVSKWEE